MSHCFLVVSRDWPGHLDTPESSGLEHQVSGGQWLERGLGTLAEVIGHRWGCAPGGRRKRRLIEEVATVRGRYCTGVRSSLQRRFQTSVLYGALERSLAERKQQFLYFCAVDKNVVLPSHTATGLCFGPCQSQFILERFLSQRQDYSSDLILTSLKVESA